VRLLGAALALSVWPVAAFAAGESPPLSSTVDPTAVLPQSQPQSQPLQTPARPNEGAAAPGEAQAQFVLTEVRFEGAAALPPEELAGAWADFRDKPVTLKDLRAIARRAEALYAKHGYPFVAVVVTPQTISGGVVHMRVVEGHVSNLTVLSKDPVARRQATAAFAPLVDREPLSLTDVEGAYQRAKAVPGLALAGALRRGDEPGGMDLVIQAKRDEWRTYVNVNNLYPKTTGPWGVLAGIDHFGHSTWGDQTSLQAYSSIDSGHQYVIRLSHQQGLNASGTTISLMGLAAWAKPAGVVAPLDIATDVQAGRVALDQPIIAREDLSLSGQVAFEVTNQKTKVFNTIGLSNDKLRVFSASLSGSWRPRFGGHLNAGLELRQGVDVFGASKLNDANLSRFGADPQSFVVRFRSDGETPTFAHLRLFGRLDAQTTEHALTAPEQYAIGNLSIGRGYEPGAAFGDRALAVVGEARLGPFPLGSRFRLEPFAFYDAARLWTLTPGLHTRRDLSSWGGGVRLDMPGKIHLELFYAEPRKPPQGLGEPTPHARVFLNLTVGLNDVFSAIGRRTSKGGGE
jgi:hemolysin activation/secretion protein